MTGPLNRRSLLAFIGIAPVAIATGAVAATQTPNEYLKELSAIDANVAVVTAEPLIVTVTADDLGIRQMVREEFARAYLGHRRRRLIT